MKQDEFSTFWSDDGKKSASLIRLEDIFKVIFDDQVSKTSTFKYYRSINSAEDAAKNFTLYESY